MSAVDDTLQAHWPKLRFLARRLAAPHDPAWDADDLCQEGAIGLLVALSRYDPTCNAMFWTYAEVVVIGAMQEAKRVRFDPVARSLRRKARVMQEATQALAQQLGRTPDGDEIAQALGLSPETYEAWRHAVAATQSRWSLDIPAGRGGMGDISFSAFLVAPTPDPALQVEHAQAQRQLAEALAHAMELLPANEAQVVRLRYWEDLTLKAIGAQLGVTESRASQLHSAAIIRLQRLLTIDDDWARVAAQLTQRQAQKKATALALHGLRRLHGNAAYLRAWRAQRKEKTHV